MTYRVFFTAHDVMLLIVEQCRLNVSAFDSILNLLSGNQAYLQ